MSKRTIILIFSAVALIFVAFLSFKYDKDHEPEETETETETETKPELKVKLKKSKINEPIQEITADSTAGENKPE
jgi:beta-lactamase regulating signal transducer with metallopeptidase domain